jgi:hypothetical protein
MSTHRALFLHARGLGENPPTSRAITERVAARCDSKTWIVSKHGVLEGWACTSLLTVRYLADWLFALLPPLGTHRESTHYGNRGTVLFWHTRQTPSHPRVARNSHVHNEIGNQCATAYRLQATP